MIHVNYIDSCTSGCLGEKSQPKNVRYRAFVEVQKIQNRLNLARTGKIAIAKSELDYLSTYVKNKKIQLAKDFFGKDIPAVFAAVIANVSHEDKPIVIDSGDPDITRPKPKIIPDKAPTVKKPVSDVCAECAGNEKYSIKPVEYVINEVRKVLPTKYCDAARKSWICEQLPTIMTKQVTTALNQMHESKEVDVKHDAYGMNLYWMNLNSEVVPTARSRILEYIRSKNGEKLTCRQIADAIESTPVKINSPLRSLKDHNDIKHEYIKENGIYEKVYFVDATPD